MSDFKNKAVNSVMWTSIRTIVGLISSPLLLILKARYLTPTEFGVLSIINIFIAIIGIIENTGLNKAIIQKDNISKNEQSSLLIFQLIIGAILSFFMILFSPLISQIFEMDSLRIYLPIMSLTIIFSAPILILSAFLEKELRFKELSIIQIIRSIALLISTSILFIFLDFGLLAVVLGQVFSSITGLILISIVTYVDHSLHFKFMFNFSDVLPFLKFGINVIGKELLTQITNRFDEMIIGFFLSAEILGYYYFAKNTLSQLRGIVSGALSKVMYPLLSQIKSNKKQLINLYRKITEYLGLIAFPVFIGIALTAEIFIPILFGEQWLNSVYMFIAISIASIPNFVTTNLSTSLLYSVNKPTQVLSIDFIVNSVYIILLLIVSWLNLGIYSIVFVYIIYLLAKPVILQFVTNTHLNLTFKTYFLSFKTSILSSLVMIVAVLLIQNLLASTINELVIFLLSILVGVISYVGMILILDKTIIIELKNLVLNK